MSNKTAIEWADYNWNFIRGCSRVSAGCEHCYAETIARRFSGPGQPYEGTISPRGKWNGNITFHEDILLAPLRWKKPRKVFVNSMSDLFHENVADEWLDKAFAVMALTPHITYQILTKRPERMREYLSDSDVPFRIARSIDDIQVQQAIEASVEEIREIPGHTGYYVTNFGRILSGGSLRCLYCGKDIAGQANKQYCGAKCRQNSHYHRKRGKPDLYLPSLKEMSPDVSGDGHRRAMLYRDGVSHRELVHRLVLTAFDRAPADGEQGCHRNGDPANNHIANLRWGTQSDNWQDRKRHGNHRAYSKLGEGDVALIHRSSKKSDAELADIFNISETQIRNVRSGRQWATDTPIEWPLKNVWSGVSVEDQEYADKRIPSLLQTPAATRFLSVEPMLGPIDLSRWLDPLGQDSCLECGADERRYLSADERKGISYTERGDAMCGECGMLCTATGYDDGVDWVIVGGESGPKARPMHPDWARSVRDQCVAAGVPFFFKQWGEYGWVGSLDDLNDTNPRADYSDTAKDRSVCVYPNGQTDPDGYTGRNGHYMDKCGKKKAGRLLDGREWNGFPKLGEKL